LGSTEIKGSSTNRARVELSKLDMDSGVSWVKTNLQMSTTVASGKAIETEDSKSSFLLDYLRASDYGGSEDVTQVVCRHSLMLCLYCSSRAWALVLCDDQLEGKVWSKNVC